MVFLLRLCSIYFDFFYFNFKAEVRVLIYKICLVLPNSAMLQTARNLILLCRRQCKINFSNEANNGEFEKKFSHDLVKSESKNIFL